MCLRQSTETLNWKFWKWETDLHVLPRMALDLYKRCSICVLCLENRSWGILLKAQSPGLGFPFCHTVMCVAVREAVLRDTAWWWYSAQHKFSARSLRSHVFRRVRKIAKSDYDVRRVSLSVRMEWLGYHWTGFHEIWIFFENLSRKIQVSLESENLGRMTIILYRVRHKSVNTGWGISRLTPPLSHERLVVRTWLAVYSGWG